MLDIKQIITNYKNFSEFMAMHEKIDTPLKVVIATKEREFNKAGIFKLFLLIQATPSSNVTLTILDYRSKLRAGLIEYLWDKGIVEGENDKASFKDSVCSEKLDLIDIKTRELNIGKQVKSILEPGYYTSSILNLSKPGVINSIFNFFLTQSLSKAAEVFDESELLFHQASQWETNYQAFIKSLLGHLKSTSTTVLFSLSRFRSNTSEEFFIRLKFIDTLETLPKKFERLNKLKTNIENVSLHFDKLIPPKIFSGDMLVVMEELELEALYQFC